MSEYQILGVFDTIEECRDEAISFLYEKEVSHTDDYECGLNCEFREGWADTRICEVTER